MYHFSADNIAEPLVLSDREHVPGTICQYLKPFQLRAMRFLHKHFKKQESCIYNDESGLGKCATVSVFLGAIGRDRKILIVVQNDDKLVNGWQFHLSVLSELAVTVITGNTDCTTSAHNVYIAKWCILKDIEDLSKLKFDFIVVDNRAQMLSNSFCLALLLKNFEKKIDIFMSSTDITLDLKLLHYVLRLCGRLEHQYLSWKSFDEKFNLPSVKDVAAKKIDLEEYFIKREILVDFCKEFRLRQYRHQCGDILPLVDDSRYKNNLETWRSEQNSKAEASQKATETIAEIIESSGEKNTEELFEQYIQTKQEKALSDEVDKIIRRIPTNLDDDDCVEIFEDPVIMSPLLFVSESEPEEEAVCTEQNIEIINLDDNDEITESNKAEKADNSANETMQNMEVINSDDVSTDIKNEPKEKNEISRKSMRKSDQPKKLNINKTSEVRKNSMRRSNTDLRSGDKELRNRKVQIIKDNENLKRKTKEKTKNKQLLQTSESNAKDISLVVVAEEKTKTIDNNNNKRSTRLTRNDEISNSANEPKPTRERRKSIAVTSAATKIEPTTQKSGKQGLEIKAQAAVKVENSTTPLPPTKDSKASAPKSPARTTTHAVINANDGIKTRSINNLEKRQTRHSKINQSKRTASTSTQKLKKTIAIKKELNEAGSMLNIEHKQQNLTPKRKSQSDESKENSLKKSPVIKTDAKNSPGIKNKSPEKSVNIKNNVAVTVPDIKIDLPKTPQSTSNKSSRRSILSNTPIAGHNKYAVSPHQGYKRATRSMQRATRSAGNTKSKYMLLPLSLDMESKVKRKSKVVQNKVDNTESVSSKATQSQNNINTSVYTNSNEIASNSNIKKNEHRPATQASVLPMSEYEEIQCGQKLTPTSTTGSEQNLPVLQKSYDFLVPPTPTILRSVELTAITTVPDSELAIVPSEHVTPDIVVLSSSQEEGSASSQSTQSRRTRVLKRKEQFKKPIACNNKANADKKAPTFSEFLAEQNQRNAAKSPDLFSNCSDIGITCSQMHNDKTTFEGFKIFGSEVKQFQQQYAASSATKQASTSRERSCLDLLEKMFDPNAKKSNKNEKKTPAAGAAKKPGSNKNKPILPAHPVEVVTKVIQQHDKRPSAIDEDVIFEITNNNTFGSMIRVNCNGDVSPVQLHTQKPTQSNKITNYLIGSSPTVLAEDDDAHLPRTPSKRSPSTNPNNNNTAGGALVKRSPKSKHCTQATKLTKWFSKHAAIKQQQYSATEDDTEITDVKKSTRKSPLKRRRLDLTFIK